MGAGSDFSVFWHFYISLYNQKRYLIAATRKPLREKAVFRKTDSFTSSSRTKVIPGQELAEQGGREVSCSELK